MTDIKATKNDEQATGVTMKLLKRDNLAFDRNNVETVVKQIRTS
jgi:hypothetical protein